ncbi:MAG: hypothetical protein PHV39_02925 [Methanomicrobium sp.]|nr:hypothetical protein [Methanomicrobium sp.]
MIKKASEMVKNESGIIEDISGYKNELECMGLVKGCVIIVKSDKNEKITVISQRNNQGSEIILLNLVASKILVNITK